MFKKPPKIYNPFGSIARGQTCKHCGHPLGPAVSHASTRQFAVTCLNMPDDNCRPRWDQHGIKTEDGKPYLSLVEHAGRIAEILEAGGHVGAYDEIMDGIRSLVARLACRPVEAIRPWEEWFAPEPAKKTRGRKKEEV
jgi:hypothetical protein